MFQKTPQNGTKFASVWIGARLIDWANAGTYELISHGPILTTSNSNWW